MKYDVSSVNTIKDNNFGGICKLFATPIDWIDVDAVKSIFTNTVETDLTFISGKDWLELECVQDSLAFTDKMQTTSAGDLFQKKLIGQFNTDDINILTQMTAFPYKKFVVKYISRNGEVKLIGTKTNGLKFGVDFNTGIIHAEKQYFAFSFDGEDTEPSPRYPV